VKTRTSSLRRPPVCMMYIVSALADTFVWLARRRSRPDLPIGEQVAKETGPRHKARLYPHLFHHPVQRPRKGATGSFQGNGTGGFGHPVGGIYGIHHPCCPPYIQREEDGFADCSHPQLRPPRGRANMPRSEARFANSHKCSQSRSSASPSSAPCPRHHYLPCLMPSISILRFSVSFSPSEPRFSLPPRLLPST
jgi:hypothetical protein